MVRCRINKKVLIYFLFLLNGNNPYPVIACQVYGKGMVSLLVKDSGIFPVSPGVSLPENNLFDLGVFFGSEAILKNRFWGNRFFWRITGCGFGNTENLSVFFGYGGHFRL